MHNPRLLKLLADLEARVKETDKTMCGFTAGSYMFNYYEARAQGQYDALEMLRAAMLDMHNTGDC